ncbi:MAG: hypothetical protein QMD04_09390 [Anaerolineales bacterium]|nr:hypothetical protein [Anaerolineales bacterium]
MKDELLWIAITGLLDRFEVELPKFFEGAFDHESCITGTFLDLIDPVEEICRVQVTGRNSPGRSK